MVLKIIEATQAKIGAMVLVEGEPFIVKSNDKSKTGKHGSAKCRIQATGVFDTNKKKVLAVPGHERFEVPNVEKRRVQILSFSENRANVMDLESYETYDVDVMPDLVSELVEEKQAEVWDIEGVKKLMRVL
ncbi:MAG: translation initiation factor IF-5A [Nanoarchaeota archaeon]|nr:translation initiation factor IF-5A [Nanoarchaeota archaeon]